EGFCVSPNIRLLSSCRGVWKGEASQGAETRLACHSEEPRSDRDDEESRLVLKTLRTRFLAEFTPSGQSEILRCAQDDSEGLGMTAWKGSSAPCEAPPFQTRGEKCRPRPEHSVGRIRPSGKPLSKLC